MYAQGNAVRMAKSNRVISTVRVINEIPPAIRTGTRHVSSQSVDRFFIFIVIRFEVGDGSYFLVRLNVA